MTELEWQESEFKVRMFLTSSGVCHYVSHSVLFLEEWLNGKKVNLKSECSEIIRGLSLRFSLGPVLARMTEWQESEFKVRMFPTLSGVCHYVSDRVLF